MKKLVFRSSIILLLLALTLGIYFSSNQKFSYGSSFIAAIVNAEVIYITVPTPSKLDGSFSNAVILEILGKIADVIIIDNIGLLSSLYAYADIAYIGGGFGKGIHNILEAATFGMPIFIGPNNQKFQEAVDLKLSLIHI